MLAVHSEPPQITLSVQAESFHPIQFPSSAPAANIPVAAKQAVFAGHYVYLAALHAPAMAIVFVSVGTSPAVQVTLTLSPSANVAVAEPVVVVVAAAAAALLFYFI